MTINVIRKWGTHYKYRCFFINVITTTTTTTTITTTIIAVYICMYINVYTFYIGMCIKSVYKYTET